MTKKPDAHGAQPSLPELIRHTYQQAATSGPAQQEAIDLLESFGFDPKLAHEQLTDAYILAVLERPAPTQLH